MTKKLYTNKIRLNRPDHVRLLLGRIINKLDDGEIAIDKAKAMGYLCNILIKAMEITDLEQRISKLEAVQHDKRTAY